MEQLTDLKKDILTDNAIGWKKFKIMVTVCCSYVVCGRVRIHLYSMGEWGWEGGGGGCSLSQCAALMWYVGGFTFTSIVLGLGGGGGGGGFTVTVCCSYVIPMWEGSGCA